MLVRFNENFGGRNNYVNVDENRKHFGLLIFDPNRTPIQMCLSLARKSRETGHPISQGCHLFVGSEVFLG